MSTEKVVVDRHITALALHEVAELTIEARGKAKLKSETLAVGPVTIWEGNVDSNLIAIAKKRVEVDFKVRSEPVTWKTVLIITCEACINNCFALFSPSPPSLTEKTPFHRYWVCETQINFGCLDVGHVSTIKSRWVREGTYVFVRQRTIHLTFK